MESQKAGRAQTATRVALEEIRQLIFNGELSADSNHLETELAERLGMSRTPVREATLILAAQGLLEVRPRKGVRINAVSAVDMAEIYDVLTELESLAARRAAEAGHSAAELQTLSDSIERMEAALLVEDREAWAKADEDFHNELVRLGGNRRIESIVSNFNDQVRRARTATLYLRPLPTRSNEDHRQLYQAILDGDAQRAHDVHQTHRSKASRLLTRLLESTGLKRL